MKMWMQMGSACVALAMAGGAFGQSACSGAKEQGAQVTAVSYSGQSQPKSDIIETADAAGSFKTLTAAIKAAGLTDTLRGKGPFTVFAPTDAAFAKLPAGTVESLLKPENKDQLIAILTYHVVPGSVTADQVTALKHATMVNGQRVNIAVAGGKVTLDGQANVVKTDIMCTNGVIHVIDAVILPVQKTIPQVAAEAGSFSTLVAAIKAAGLAEALSGKGPFTVFAPTDEAFQKLPAGTLESLLKPENKEKLAAILKFHVIPGAVYSDQAVKLSDSGKTLQGSSFQIKVKDGKVMIGNSAAMANVTATDIESSNGVIHVIDTVLLPN